MVVEVEGEREDRWEASFDRNGRVNLVPSHISSFNNVDEFKDEIVIDMFIQPDGRLVTSAEDDCEQCTCLTPSFHVSWIIYHLVS